MTCTELDAVLEAIAQAESEEQVRRAAIDALVAHPEDATPQILLSIARRRAQTLMDR